jgi:hypothetical protein
MRCTTQRQDEIGPGLHQAFLTLPVNFNLGYLVAPLQVIRAVEDYQVENNLPKTGQPDQRLNSLLGIF